MDLGRISTAMVTPFNADGSIDFNSTEKLIEHLLGTGTDSIVVSGTTGESPTLSSKEKEELISLTVKTVNGRVPVIAGTGSNNTAASIESTKAAEAAGVDGVMLVVPYYNKPDQRGMYAHFEAIAKNTELPIMLYNIPGRSVVNMLPETVIELSKIPNITTVKEASGNLDQMTEILRLADEDFKVYSGDDGLTLPLLSIGGAGVVSVASHVVGRDMQMMVKAFNEGRHKDAAFIHQSLLPLIRALFSKPNPVPVKYALSKLGVEAGGVRLPLLGLTDDEKKQFDTVWDAYLENQQKFN